MVLIALAVGEAIPGQPTSRSTSRRPHHRQADKLIKQLELPLLKAEAVRQLLRLGKDAAPDLGRALGDPRPEVVLCVAQMLRLLGPDAMAALNDMEQLSKSSDTTLANAARYALSAVRPAGITVVSAYNKGELLELDAKGKVLHTITGLGTIFDAQRLADGNYLVTLINQGIVKVVDRRGKEVWSRKDLRTPTSAKPLADGNTLICETGRKRVVEVDPKGEVVWKVEANGAYDATRLPSGNTLIAEYGGNRVVEVDPQGKVVWQLAGRSGAIGASRLTNGNTLICEYTGRRVVEVDKQGKTVFELKDVTNPYSALRLANGHTLVAGTTGLAEYDQKGKRLWQEQLGITASVERY